MCLRIMGCLLLLAAPPGAVASDLYDTINRLRTVQGGCASAQDLPPLKPQPALERAARDLSQGADLQQGLKDAGYRSTRARVLSFTGEGIGGRAASVLARPDYCRQLQEAGMTDVGVYADARQVWIVIAAPFAPPVAALLPQAAGQRVLELVNQARAAPRNCGERAFKAAPPVRWNDVLAEAARLHAEDMARHGYFSHTGRDGSTPAQRVLRAGYRYRSTGENIAAGAQTPDEVVAGWIKSPGHCANLMSPAYTEMGAAFVIERASKMGVYWAQLFGTPR